MEWAGLLLAVLALWILIRSAIRLKRRLTDEEPSKEPDGQAQRREGAVTRKRDETLCCSFCGKSQGKVRKLIAGPSVYICDECIGLCNDIIAEEIEPEAASPSGQPPPAGPPDCERLLEISRGVSSAAHTMRRTWIIDDSEGAIIIHEMADRIAVLAQQLRAEIAR